MTTSRSIGTTRKPGTTAVFDEDHSPRLLRETNAWDIYNNEARKVDNELVKDWTATLNSLLVFAAIFSAVLAAFIIESKKLLEQDYSEAMYDAMVFYMGNVANGTFTPYQRADFEPNSTAISVNCLFFGSLSASLVAAFASVVALQWVADFDALVTRSESLPIKKARRRHFRFMGVEKWRMGEIIAALPLILYFSVALFLAGIIQWMLYLHKTVAYVVIVGAVLTALFYFSSTLLAVVFISAPYKSPLSRWIYSIYCSLFNLAHRVFWAIRTWRDPSWSVMHQQDFKSVRKREDLAVKKTTTLDRQAINWLVRQVGISNPWNRLVIIVGEFIRLEQERLDFEEFMESPWIQILDILFFAPTSGQRRVTGKAGVQTMGDIWDIFYFVYLKQGPVGARLEPGDVRTFKRRWDKFDTEMTGYIRIEQIVPFLATLSRTLEVSIYPKPYRLSDLRAYVRDSPQGSFNSRRLNERLDELNWVEVKRRKRIQNRVYWEAQLVARKDGGRVSFLRTLALIGYSRIFEEEKEDEIDDHIRGRAFADELKEAIRTDMVKRLLLTVYYRRKFLKWRENRQRLWHSIEAPGNVGPLTSHDEEMEVKEERHTGDVPGTVGPFPLQDAEATRREEPHRQHDSDVPVD